MGPFTRRNRFWGEEMSEKVFDYAMLYDEELDFFRLKGYIALSPKAAKEICQEATLNSPG